MLLETKAVTGLASLHIQDWISDGIAFLGVIVTGVFTAMVWKATARSSDIAEKSFQMAENMRSKNETQYFALRQLFRRHALEFYQKIITYLRKGNMMAGVKTDLDIPQSEIATYFTQEEHEQLIKASEICQRHINNFWFEHGFAKSAWTPDEARERANDASLTADECSQIIDKLREKWGIHA